MDDASHDYGSHPNDNPHVPVLAGSGGGAGGWGRSGSGGGVVHVEARGAIVVDGTVDADGEVAYDGRSSAGAGGTIYLKGETFRGTATGVLTAKGGAGYYDTKNSRYSEKSGAGGGGRIAVWTGFDWNGRLHSSRLQMATTPTGLGESFDYSGAYTVAGGYSDRTVAVGTDKTVNEAKTVGEPGTVWFAHVLPPQGLMLFVR